MSVPGEKRRRWDSPTYGRAISAVLIRTHKKADKCALRRLIVNAPAGAQASRRGEVEPATPLAVLDFDQPEVGIEGDFLRHARFDEIGPDPFLRVGAGP